MSWADLKRKYESGKCSASESTEDMVARRILHAFSLTEKGLWKAEREAGLENQRHADSTLLERVSRLALASCNRSVRLPVVRDVKSFKEAEDILAELSETHWATCSRPLALAYRIKDTKDIRVLQNKGAADVLYLPELPPSFCVLRSRDGQSVLVDCDADAYFGILFGRKAQ